MFCLDALRTQRRKSWVAHHEDLKISEHRPIPFAEKGGVMRAATLTAPTARSAMIQHLRERLASGRLCLRVRWDDPRMDALLGILIAGPTFH